MIKIIIGLFLLLIFLTISISNHEKRKKINQIKTSDYLYKISVLLEECEIISGYDTNKMDPYINIMNPGGSFYSILSEKGESKYSTYVRFIHKGFAFLAGPFDVSEIGVKVAFLQKEKTYIYYNKKDFSDFYFDLNFIYS